MTTLEYLETPETMLPRELAFGALRVAEAPTLFHQRLDSAVLPGLQLTPADLLGSW